MLLPVVGTMGYLLLAGDNDTATNNINPETLTMTELTIQHVRGKQLEQYRQGVESLILIT